MTKYRRIALGVALGQFTSETVTIDAFENANQEEAEALIAEAGAWQPFEYWRPKELIDEIEALADTVERALKDIAPKVEVPITECDLDMFNEVVYSNNTFSWTFPDQYDNQVNIEFISQDEFDQRST